MTMKPSKIFDIALKVTSCERDAVLSPSRQRKAVDARCLFVHLSRVYGYRGRTPYYTEIAPKIARAPGEAAYLARRAERLLSCQAVGHATDFQCYVTRAKRALDVSR
jgi:hypothetical protein